LPWPLVASSTVVTAAAVSYLEPGARAIAPFRRGLFPQLSGYGDARHVALTFDDGPDPVSTPHLVNLLAEWNVHATFFMLGSMAAAAPGLAREVAARIAVAGVDGNTATMTVAGLAYTTDQGFYPQWTPGLIWASHSLLTRVEPTKSETTEVVGLRLSDPSPAGTGVVSQDVFNLYNNASEGSPLERTTTRQQVMNSMASDDRLLGELLALFGVIALIAAPCAIANVTSGRVLMQRRDIAMLKALGDETRLRIVSRLSRGGPSSIVALTGEFDISRQAVSKHLRVLEGAGLVRGSRPGRESTWELLPRRLQQARQSLDQISADWDDALGRLREFVEK